MAKKEIKTDLWVARQLDDSKIKYDAQGSDVKEINDALQSASKRGTGNAGYPEYVAVVKDFVIVIEDKADLAKHQKLTDTGILSVEQKDIADYAVNGAYFYAKHIAQNSSFHKIFAIGVSGDEKHHKITPLYVDDRDGYILIQKRNISLCLLNKAWTIELFANRKRDYLWITMIENTSGKHYVLCPEMILQQNENSYSNQLSIRSCFSGIGLSAQRAWKLSERTSSTFLLQIIMTILLIPFFTSTLRQSGTNIKVHSRLRKVPKRLCRALNHCLVAFSPRSKQRSYQLRTL